MTVALAPPSAATTVTPEQLELIKKTVANGATADELKLYLFDCARQGVHPLDKLIHFTVHKLKDGGRKYTPVTSIDFMRIQAADTNEYAGSDDARFEAGAVGGPPLAATVKVYRLVQAQRCSFEATARWAEYKPEQNDFMWRKMPYTMLAKCAEALALRKGFPRQLAGLYAKEEMDQAGGPSNGYTVTAPPVAAPLPAASDRKDAPAGALEIPAALSTPAPNGVAAGTSLPRGAVYITKVDSGTGAAKGFLYHSGQGAAPRNGFAIYDDRIKAQAEQFCQDARPAVVTFKESAAGKTYVTGITDAQTGELHEDDGPITDMLKDSDIAF